MKKNSPKNLPPDNKRMTKENMPFIVVEVALLVAYMTKMADKALMIPILFFVIGGQQIYNALRFYNEDPKLKQFYFSCGFASFSVGLFLMLNGTMLK